MYFITFEALYGWRVKGMTLDASPVAGPLNWVYIKRMVGVLPAVRRRMRIAKSKFAAVAMFLCTLSYAMAQTTALGTVSARGGMKVDGHTVQGDATLFDGTQVETGQNSAVLRMGNEIEIRLATESSGTLYKDRFVLTKGSSELKATKKFQIVVQGLHISSVLEQSQGTVTLINGTVQVSALSGEFYVRDDQGTLVSQITSGNSASFGAQPQEVASNKEQEQEDKEQRPQSPVEQHRLSKKAGWILLGTGAAGLATGLYIANSGGTPASR